MKNIIYLDGSWDFRLDADKAGLNQGYFHSSFNDTINLPGTTSQSKKGTPNKEREPGFLTDEYRFEGYAWYRKSFNIKEKNFKNAKLFLERTRKTMLWVNGRRIGKVLDSLNAPHIYDIGESLRAGENTITIMVDNTDYPTNGGHMTSQDTQTNWNGITGEISVRIYEDVYIDNIRTFPDIHNKSVKVKLRINGADGINIAVFAFMEDDIHEKQHFELCADEYGYSEFTYKMDGDTKLWSEYTPYIYTLVIELESGESIRTCFGMREFSTEGMEFRINEKPVFLRGKHDGMVFPLTGAAPTDTESWIKTLKTAKDYGINHYRFHTCCPPDAAFTAADLLGIYMEPELPFWGTIHAENEEGFNKEEQEYLISEGYRILESFGNHPSFVMFSLGNELWGSPERMNLILKNYKEFDSSRLYTIGSNNFQFYPTIVENDDFFCGVRLSRERLIRGSYAMCDAPLGHIQTDIPNASYCYDNIICPAASDAVEAEETEIEIQYGTGVKRVKASGSKAGLEPNIPVISHEVGQYSFYPDFNEIDKYTGVLKAENLKIFRERLAEKGMLSKWKEFFKANGRFAAECYKNEIETAMRSEKLAGFQLLDIQDFPGQGTALVGILNSFMESKGFITPEKWKGFCSDKILLADFKSYVITDKRFTASIYARCYKPEGFKDDYIRWEISDGGRTAGGGELAADGNKTGLFKIGAVNWNIPEDYKTPKKLTLTLTAKNTENSYDLWYFPELKSWNPTDGNKIIVTDSTDTAVKTLREGGNVLLASENLKNYVEGTYCTDFWCYPMFKTISEQMNKPVPVGTMGLLIDNSHKALKYFASEYYSTPQWYNIVKSGVCAVLDDAPKDFYPIVQTIDNIERNHKLGNLFEANVLNGKLIVCTMSLRRLFESIEGKWFVKSVCDYCGSESFNPKYRLDEEYIRSIFI